MRKNIKNTTFNNGKDVMLEDIFEDNGFFFLQIGHDKTDLKSYFGSSRLDLIDIIIDHLERIKEFHRKELEEEFFRVNK